MGEVRVATQVRGLGAANGASAQTVEVLADTGATLTMLPSDVLARAGVKADSTVKVGAADGRVAERPAGNALVTILGESTAVRVLLGQDDEMALLGLTALEQIGLAVDTVSRKLVSDPFNLL